MATKKPKPCPKCRLLAERVEELKDVARERGNDHDYVYDRLMEVKDQYTGLIAWNVLALGIVSLGMVGWVVFT